MTKVERVDILLDAIGLIGDDLVAESSGISNILPIPSKLKLNLMVMRRLIAAAVCLVLVSALIPLSVYLYNNHIAPAFQPAGTTEETTEKAESSAEESRIDLTIPEGYSLDKNVSFEMMSGSVNGSAKRKVTVHVAMLRSNEDSSPATYIELRTYDGKTVTDTLFEKGCGMVILSEDTYHITVFNTEITFDIDKAGYAKIVKYNIYDGEFYESIEFLQKRVYFTLLTAAHLEESRVETYNMFVDFAEELELQGNARLILDTYTADTRSLYEFSDSTPTPNIIEDRKNGKNTWTIDRIAEVNGYIPKEEPLPENLKTYETEDGWLISGITAEPELYKVVGCTDKMGKTATVPTEFLGYKVILLAHAALQNCKAETLIIPAGLEKVEMQLWGDSIRKIIIECDDNTKFVEKCFMNQTVEEVIFTGNKTVIEEALFYLCRNLKKVTLPSGLETISEMAFQDCEALEELNLPDGIKLIEKRAFYSCGSLKSLVLPASLEKVGEDAFAICTQLESIEILAGLDDFPQGLFWEHNCESITVPEGVRSIDDLAVKSDALKYLYLPSTLELFVTYGVDLPSSEIEAIYYNGTMEMWHNVEKRELISTKYNEYTVYCTDGEIVMFPGGLPME